MATNRTIFKTADPKTAGAKGNKDTKSTHARTKNDGLGHVTRGAEKSEHVSQHMQCALDSTRTGINHGATTG